MQDIINQMANEIRVCGNTIDSYYNSKRMRKCTSTMLWTTTDWIAVRFLRAMEWKTRLTQHIEEFNSIRGRMHDHLSLSSAKEQRNIHTSLSNIISTLTSAKRPWELKVAAFDKSLGREAWVKDSEKLKEVLLEMEGEDTAEHYKGAFSKDEEGSKKEQDMAKDVLEAVRRDIQTTVTQICTQNEDLFERKLEFLSTRFKTAIDNSAKFVVQALDGPHAKLENEVCIGRLAVQFEVTC